MIDLTKYEDIVRKYTQPLYKYCYCKLKFDESLVEETVSDVMRTLYEKWDSLDVGDNIRAWLYRVADNCIKHNLTLRSKYYSHNDSLEESVENGKLDHFKHYDEYFADDSFEEEYIDRIILALPDEYKEIFKLRYLEKKTITETANIIGLPYSTLYSRLAKIEAIVKKEIKKIFK